MTWIGTRLVAAMLVLLAGSVWAGEQQADAWQPLAPGVMVRSGTIPGGGWLSVKAQGPEGREWVVKSLLEPALARAQQLLDSREGAGGTLRARVDALRSRLESVRRGGGSDRPECYVILNPRISEYAGWTYSSANGAVNTCDSTYVWADAYAYVGNSIGTNGDQMYRFDEGFGYAEASAWVSTQGVPPCAFADDYVDDGEFLYYRYALSGVCSFL